MERNLIVLQWCTFIYSNNSVIIWKAHDRCLIFLCEAKIQTVFFYDFVFAPNGFGASGEGDAKLLKAFLQVPNVSRNRSQSFCLSISPLRIRVKLKMLFDTDANIYYCRRILRVEKSAVLWDSIFWISYLHIYDVWGRLNGLCWISGVLNVGYILFQYEIVIQCNVYVHMCIYRNWAQWVSICKNYISVVKEQK